ncbi:MAG TPA: pyridoxal phosphate-dependent aminotransferase [Terriglobales bacterium]|nr:pyridoxal phosphate-dependent aminotransferase [Terriglobales bacterium]
MFSKRTGWKLSPNALTLAQRELAEVGREVLDLTASNPTRVGLTYDGDAIVAALAQPAGLDYDPQPKGLLAARQAVSHYYREQHEVFSADADKIVLATSTSEAYSHLFRLLCNSEDEVLVPKPSYPLFDFLADLADVRLAPYPLIYDHGWQIDLAFLYKAVNHRTRAVVVVHPNNPTGSYVHDDEISGLNSFCREYNLALIVDEVFLDYAVDGADRPTFAGNSDALTFTLSGLSKLSGLPQMKVSWIVSSGPEERVEAAMDRLEIIADTFLSVSGPMQLASPALLEQRKHVQPLLLDRLRANLEELDRQLGHSSSCKRLDMEGGWYAVLRVPVTRSDEELAIKILRESSVLVHPGHFYDFPQDGYLVLSLITSTDQFREGVRRLVQVVESN